MKEYFFKLKLFIKYLFYSFVSELKSIIKSSTKLLLICLIIIGTIDLYRGGRFTAIISLLFIISYLRREWIAGHFIYKHKKESKEKYIKEYKEGIGK